jgi:glycosyltransferase involved in cell wall biosynthesis
MPADSPLRICHVITRMIVGGAQENTLLTILGHLRKGHQVTLVTGPSPGPEGELLKHREAPPFETVVLPSSCREINPWLDYRAYGEFRRFLRGRCFDVVHTHSSKAGVIGRAAAWGEGVPFVCHTVHGLPFHAYESAWRNHLYKAAERWAARRCHRIFAVAQAMVDQCLAARIAPPEKFKVVYSGMELEPYLTSRPDPALRTSLGIPEGVPVVGTIARLFPLKGYEDLLPAAAKIVQAVPETRFLLVGDGVMRQDMERDIARLGLAANFAFAGLVSPSEVPRYTALMDVMVHLSLREGLPRGVVQALASGKPAVGYALDGTPEVIRDGETGRLIGPQDVAGVAQAVVGLLQDPAAARRMGAAGRELVRARFDWLAMADILEDEYRRGVVAAARK